MALGFFLFAAAVSPAVLGCLWELRSNRREARSHPDTAVYRAIFDRAERQLLVLLAGVSVLVVGGVMIGFLA